MSDSHYETAEAEKVSRRCRVKPVRLRLLADARSRLQLQWLRNRASPPLLLQSSSTLASMLQPDVEFLTDPAPAPAPAVQATAMPAPIPPPLLPECSDERIPLAELLCRMDSRE